MSVRKVKKDQATSTAAPQKKKKRKMYPYEYRLLSENCAEEEMTSEEKGIEKINLVYTKMLKSHRRHVYESSLVQKCWRQVEPDPRRKKRRKKKKKTIEPLPAMIDTEPKESLKPPFFIN